MENDKTPGPPQFQTKMVKILASEGEEWMRDLLKAIWEEEIMPKHLVKSLMVSRYLEKAYDRIPRKVKFWCLRKRNVLEKLVRMVEMIYKITWTQVITVVGEPETFEVSVVLHQGSSLVLDVLCEEIRNEELRELLNADDLVITA
ncbi:uncharacterized protein [Palaemon carinicauda]|uniref:uncharacterized protein n=1 Tax=Palaemon carinicauda TaxID=392227 RepID=UPI0035B60435